MDDAILRTAAIDALNGIEISRNASWYEFYQKAITAVGTLPSAQQWISCKKRLPNRDEYIKNNGLFIVSDGNRSYSEWYDIYDKRRFGEPTMSGFRVDYAVTHWMPFPKPYKEHDDADHD